MYDIRHELAHMTAPSAMKEMLNPTFKCVQGACTYDIHTIRYKDHALLVNIKMPKLTHDVS